MSSPFVPIEKAELDWHENLPFSIQYNDIYHSSNGGLQQSRHVFIEGNCLLERWQNFKTNSSCQFTIAETGFGTGLNFLLTWQLWEQYAPDTAKLHYISCEKHPLAYEDLQKSLNNWPQLDSYAVQLLEQYPVLTPGYHHLSFNNGRVILTIMLGEALDCFEQLLICGEPNLELSLRTSFIDAWYLDGFAPSKNEKMWSASLISVISMLSKHGTTLATYSAAAQVKKNLVDYGFTVQKKKGFGPKRHMITASFNKPQNFKSKYRHTPWHIGSPHVYKEKSAIIIGAGLAGCFSAWSLVERGWNVTLIEELDTPGQYGSANQQAILFPKLSAYKSPLTQFMLSAFLYSYQFYQKFLKSSDLGQLNGCLLLAYDEKEKMVQLSLKEWLTCYPELGILVDEAQASQLAGLPLSQSGLFIPNSGWINSPLLCNKLIDRPEIQLVSGCKIKTLGFNHGYWSVDNFTAPVVILANGHKINHFQQTSYLPAKPIRGQMTAISATKDSARLQIPLCAEGHVLPGKNGLHRFGATYELGVDNPELRSQDDIINLSRLEKTTPNIVWSGQVKEHWAGIRASTPDYLPLVGQIAIKEEFVSIFSGLASNSKRWIAHPGAYYKGLYACAGFGSRGLTAIPLCAEWLASSINNETGYLPRNIIQSLSPARFLRKNIMRGIE